MTNGFNANGAMSQLLLLLGDQLDHHHPIFQSLDTVQDTIIMAELVSETHYVPHNKLKIALIFSAMRHFADELKQRGFKVSYYPYEDTEGWCADFKQLLEKQLSEKTYQSLHLIEAGEHRLQEQFLHWQQSWSIEVKIHPASHFFFSVRQMQDWFGGRKAPRMEHFYRWARQKTGLLMQGGEPEGGQYNFDKHNREPWDANKTPPPPITFPIDSSTQNVLELVEERFADFPGQLKHFDFAVTTKQAEQALQDFIEHRLPEFGAYQDALSDKNSKLYHSLLSAYINLGQLNPMAVCQAAERAYYEGKAPLNAVEGFIRQILGWREYVRGIYWWQGKDYADRNALRATRALPDWFWSGNTQMRCLQKAIQSSLESAYAHHIQRLMVIGNFALLAGLDVKAVCQWYLAVYIDAFEWVELPNTLGMALYGDGGLLASKPYAASGRYIHKMGNHCQHCRYKPTRMTGPDACPYNALYWHFIHRHRERLEKNRRMGLMLSQWQKKSNEEQQAILDWAEHNLGTLSQL
ncbi:(6-4) photolyase [Saliniradius amylolyticus]|uniref:(6-4) photolyase n=1 Tax=Saliniradius amylolyticus TaxID=2183582 RepID=A0A2S2E5E3_9ALTE|nr:cryptochrome/photolyase family protein [Saliniradius amylolyticus]AWL12853.1 (6-4) photolyase [Saliniradius amylolyticus]